MSVLTQNQYIEKFRGLDIMDGRVFLDRSMMAAVQERLTNLEFGLELIGGFGEAPSIAYHNENGLPESHPLRGLPTMFDHCRQIAKFVMLGE